MAEYGGEDGERVGEVREWLGFLEQLFKLCREFETRLRFVVVTSDVTPLSHLGVQFDNAVTIPPLSEQTALIMSLTLKPKLKVPIHPLTNPPTRSPPTHPRSHSHSLTSSLTHPLTH